MCYLKNEKKKGGFTIIELLVVVSIISLIVAAALYLVNDSREKARIGAGLEFSDSLKTALSQDMVSYWPFDSLNGNITPDIWGKNDGVVTGAVLAKGIIGNALQFDGNDFVTTGKTNLNIGGPLTISLWFKPDGNIQCRQTLVGKGGWASGWRIEYEAPVSSAGGDNCGTGGKGLNKISIFATPEGVCSNKSISIKRWNHIALTYYPSVIKLYIDGHLDNTVNTNTNIPNINNNVLGFDYRGLIDEVQIFNKSLTAKEIKEIYAVGAKKFDLAIK